MRSFLATFVPFATMLIGLPLLGAGLAGRPLAPYLEFPPRARSVQHSDFSWAAFAALAALIALVVTAIALRAMQSYRLGPPAAAAILPRPFPRWGWAGLAAGAVAWILAWTRLDWMAAVQAHTFTPLWLAYIVAVNAWCARRTGRSLMTDQTRYFAALFPLSAVFWWFFEYLNRFVGNWYYVGEDFSAWSYFWTATLPFATVLPAVLSTRDLIRSWAWFRRAFGRVRPLPGFQHPLIPWAVLAASAGGLAGLAAAPDCLYPLVWVAPLMLLTAVRSLRREPHLFQALAGSDWVGPAAASLAALLCGFVWEMWNFYSLAKWKYSLPLVQRFEVFEMPLLGYFGYLPFGLECAAVGEWIEYLMERRRTGP